MPFDSLRLAKQSLKHCFMLHLRLYVGHALMTVETVFEVSALVLLQFNAIAAQVTDTMTQAGTTGTMVLPLWHDLLT